MANWIVANMVTGWGIVDKVERSNVELAAWREMWGVARELIVSPYTHVYTTQEDVGSASRLGRGDYVYFTGTASDTTQWAYSVRAYAIHRTKMAD